MPTSSADAVVTRRRALLLAPLAAAWPLQSWASAPPVIASFSILADMARALLPDTVDVVALVGPDADSHAFQPRPADAERIARAPLVVVNGLGFEGWMDRLVRASGYTGPVIVASAGIRPLRAAKSDHGHGHGHDHGHDHGGTDPHAWQSLPLARRYVDNLERAFAARWPAERAAIEARAADYRGRIDALDARIRGWLDRVPRTERRIITAHDAFGYFAAEYGVEILAPRGWSTASEPSAAAVGRLVQQIRRQRVRAVFLENISDPRLVRRIADEGGAAVGGTLYSDALSRPGGPADSYLRMVEHNATLIARALGAAV